MGTKAMKTRAIYFLQAFLHRGNKDRMLSMRPVLIDTNCRRTGFKLKRFSWHLPCLRLKKLGQVLKNASLLVSSFIGRIGTTIR